MEVTLEEIKEYVRIDSSAEDDLLLVLKATAESLCGTVLRRNLDEVGRDTGTG